MKQLLILLLAIPLSVSLSAQNNDSATFNYLKGLEEKNAKRYLSASNYFVKAISFDPRYVSAHIENGFANKEMRKTDASKQDFTKVLELEPGNEIAIKELADLYFAYRQYQNAIDMASKCKTCADKDKIIALSYFNLEDYGRAEKLLHALVAKNPKDAEATYTLARNYLEMGLEAKAIPWYVKAVQLDEKRNKWHFELGLLYYNNNNYKGAVASFNKAAQEGFVKGNDFNENLGFAYIYSGDHENGEKLIGEVIARKPGDKQLIRDVATALFDIKNYDKSLAYCQKLLELDIKDGKALYQAGLCFQKMGQVERGMQMCDKAIELDPTLAGLKSKKLSPGM